MMNYDFIKQSIYLEHLPPPTLALLLAVAFLLGAIHALGPGHGKSLMAAYLVGNRGTIKDVLVLGVSLTVAHVFSVVVMGLVVLWLEDFFLPGTIGLYLGLASGVLITLIGVWIIITRWKAFRKSVYHQKNYPINISKNLNHHLLSTPHSHFEHSHEHHGHSHHHHHFDRRLSLWENLALGISGGIVPCPKALVILLLAISLQKIQLGLVIIVVFSLGLASVLIILGILLVKSTHIFTDRIERKGLYLLPVLGGMVIVFLGIWVVFQTGGQLW